MNEGSKSFSLAARLFDNERRKAARYLYNWCRHCDDAIDRAGSPDAAEERLRELDEKTRDALTGEPTQEPAFQALQTIAKKYGIFQHYPIELLEGMRMDVEGVRYRTTEDLELYCYRVASVVGLMMVHVMGVSSEDAIEHASDLGMAMQMTNIARDMKEDWEMGRIYIPEEWFEDLGQRAPHPESKEFDADLFALVADRLILEAERRYTSGRAGLRYLPLRAAFAVSAASAIYRAIGLEVVRRGPQAWDERVVISGSKKFYLVLRSSIRVLLTIPGRIFKPWKPVRLTSPYRFPVGH